MRLTKGLTNTVRAGGQAIRGTQMIPGAAAAHDEERAQQDAVAGAHGHRACAVSDTRFLISSIRSRAWVA